MHVDGVGGRGSHWSRQRACGSMCRYLSRVIFGIYPPRHDQDATKVCMGTNALEKDMGNSVSNIKQWWWWIAVRRWLTGFVTLTTLIIIHVIVVAMNLCGSFMIAPTSMNKPC